MKFAQRKRIVRDLRELARSRGHYGDLYSDRVPSLGTWEEEQSILGLRLDTPCYPRSEAADRLIKELARAAVLAEPLSRPATTGDKVDQRQTANARKLQRERRKAS